MIVVNDVIGYIACVLTVIVGVPQFIKTILTKKVTAVSLPSFVLYYLGCVFWILYVTLTPNKWLPLGLTDIFSCFVLTCTLVAIYKYSYLTKLEEQKKGKDVKFGYFQSRISPRAFGSILFGLYVIYAVFFVVTFVTQFSLGSNKVLKYIFFVLAFLGVTVVFLGQTVKTFKTRSTEGLSFGIVFISLLLNSLWEISWILRLKLANPPYSHPDFIVSVPELKANLVEELWVGMALQLMGVVVFLAQTIAYLMFHDWKSKKDELTLWKLIKSRKQKTTKLASA